MARNVFSVPIFFIVFRETLEAAIIVSVLLGLVEQIVHQDPALIPGAVSHTLTVSTSDQEKDKADSNEGVVTPQELTSGEDLQVNAKRLLRRMRIYIFAGAFLGLFFALAIGAAFIAVWFTQAADLWSKSEALWEGIFSLVASLIIFAMGIGMLKMDRAKAKWRVKLQRAFAGKAESRGAKTGKYVLFILPFITVLREGMEAVVFVGGVSLGQPATSIPIAAIVGLVCGLICGYLIYAFASRTTLTIFMVVMTNFLLLIGAGLFSKAVWDFQENAFNNLLGADVDDTGGDGPGSFDVRGNVWHLDCCNPENNFDSDGWTIFSAIFGWTNSATVGSVLSYVFYWLAVVAVLIHMKFKEGRTKLLGKESAMGRKRRERMEAQEASAVAAAEKSD
ncbi:Ftr1 protein [Dichomitus squalens]|uniref:Ftr1 protein n=1 Tax=Dichomitus squalens TaxID=114155 RepID=A0A4Q9NHA1_9APHY|nr:Ftr1 protein [Dichomitus squalens LYAD-421 SS1]EJF63923.1 Ftr1 protein [Dichomitus squalens LYAD-421 SS1]TBU31474.1 Ftr1 protein [Dichomitus squalens]TBU40098.1 Ftr1 protein [Dichomitus squalens]